MEDYYIRVTPKGKKFFHECIGPEGEVMDTRTSHHQYIKCSIVNDETNPKPGVLSWHKTLDAQAKLYGFNLLGYAYERKEEDGS